MEVCKEVAMSGFILKLQESLQPFLEKHLNDFLHDGSNWHWKTRNIKK